MAVANEWARSSTRLGSGAQTTAQKMSSTHGSRRRAGQLKYRKLCTESGYPSASSTDATECFQMPSDKPVDSSPSRQVCWDDE